jgi:hypothetical protein
MAEDTEKINSIIDDLANGKYKSEQSAILALVNAGMSYEDAALNVSIMETIDIIRP